MATIYNDRKNFEKLKGGCQMKVDRLVSIIMILLDKERIGAQELADMFEVSPRTIYRDIDTINMAGINILNSSQLIPPHFR
ncbi:MAG: HTH domain-containing protein [Bacteroidaceae bacterium]|nr:HTH domain-containing protein [Bacteroidaceae bacterium]